MLVGRENLTKTDVSCERFLYESTIFVQFVKAAFLAHLRIFILRYTNVLIIMQAAYALC